MMMMMLMMMMFLSFVLFILYLRSNVEMAGKLYDEIVAQVPGAIIETAVGEPGDDDDNDDDDDDDVSGGARRGTRDVSPLISFKV